MEGQRSIVIIGGGISGLALGAYIKDGGFNSVILEKSNRVGGVIRSEYKMIISWSTEQILVLVILN